MRVDAYEFGRVTIDGVRYEHDVIVESVEVLRLPTPDLVRLLNEGVPAGTNLRLHITC